MEPDAEKEIEKPKRRGGCLRCLGRLALVGLVVLAGLLVWLNGPGMRWLGPKIAKHFLEKASFEGDLRIGGTVLGGISVFDLDLRSEGSIERLVIDRLETDYRFSEIIKGKLRGISGEGVHLDLRLIEKVEEEEKEPVDFAVLGKTLNNIRGLITPVEVDLEGVSISVKKDDQLLIGIGNSALKHATDSDLIGLDLGMVTDASGRTLQPQNAKISWDEGKLALNQLDLLPVVGLRDVEILLPESGEVAVTGKLRLGDAVLNLNVGAGIEDVRLDLVEGALDFGKIPKGFGIAFPILGRMTSLALEIRQVYPEWQMAEGTVEIFLEDFYYDGWGGPELALGVNLNEGNIEAKVTGQSLGSQFSLEGGGGFERGKLEAEGLVMGTVAGSLRVEKADMVLRELDTKLEMGGRFKDFPESEISGSWSVDLDAGIFSGVNADLVVKATEVEASPIRLDASYAGKIVTVRAFETENQIISGTFDTTTQGYDLKESMKEFRTESIAPWLEGAGLELPGSGVLSLEWEGSGNLLAKEHKGSLLDLLGVWSPMKAEDEEAVAPITAKGSVEYDWPQFVEVNQLVVETEGQKIELEGKMADHEVELKKLVWSDEAGEIATGEGKLPIPKDFSKFREFLGNDDRPLDLKISSDSLPLAKLEPWVKGLEKIGDGATGKVSIEIGGSLATPEVDTTVELRGVGVRDNPNLPAMDMTLSMDAGGGVAKITGEIVAPDYGPAKINAEMPFLPKKWANDPDSLKQAQVQAALVLPTVDLSRFKALIPGAKELKGIAAGNFAVSGTLGSPKVNGSLSLNGGGLEFESASIPKLDGIMLEVNANLDEIAIKGGIKKLEGGYLDIDGKMALRDTEKRKFGDLDFSLTGRGLPLVRNDFMIVRANADLRIQGGMADAALTGEIGIVDSMFYKDIELIPVGKPFLEPSPAALPAVNTKQDLGSAVPSPFGDWTSNVVVKTVDPLRIRGNLGKGDVDVALRVGGTLGDPKPTGTVRFRDGVATLPFCKLEVKKAILTFTPATGLDPVVELRATAEPRPYRIQIYANGRMSNPQLTLTSQPPMPENEIMTLLATGTTSAGLEDSQAASSRAMQLLIEELRKGRFLFGKQLRPVLGLLDNVDFSLSEKDPYDTATYNSARLKLSDKWFLSVGIDSEGYQRVMAIYRLRFK